MELSDVDRVILSNLREKENAPRPLNRDFYKEIVSPTPSTSGNVSHEYVPPHQPNVDSATEATVRMILKESQPLIDKAALKLVAPNAVNVEGQQYHDLVKLSLDEAAVVHKEEELLNISRKKANAPFTGRR